VHGVFWQYDGSATGTKKTSRGTCFVVVGIIVHLPFLPGGDGRDGDRRRPGGMG
jgi:hypothetical protein